MVQILYSWLGSYEHLTDKDPAWLYLLIGFLALLPAYFLYVLIASLYFMKNNAGIDNWAIAASSKYLWVNLRPMKHGWIPVQHNQLNLRIDVESICDIAVIIRRTEHRHAGRLLNEKVQQQAQYIALGLKEELGTSDKMLLDKELDFLQLECIKMPMEPFFPYIISQDKSIMVRWRSELRPNLSDVIRQIRMVTFMPENQDHSYVR